MIPKGAHDHVVAVAQCRHGMGVVGMPHEMAGLRADEVTIAEVLSEAGYATGHVGKWHLGYSPDTMPNGQGFDDSFGHMGGCIDNYSHFFYWSGPNVHDLWRDKDEHFEDGEYFPDLMVREALAFLDTNRDTNHITIRQQYQESRGDAYIGGQAGALGPQRILDDLHDHFVAFPNQRMNGWLRWWIRQITG